MAKKTTVSIIYQGPAPDGVEISDTGQWAEHGKPIDVDADVAEALLRAGLPDDEQAAAEVPAKERVWVKAGGGS